MEVMRQELDTRETAHVIEVCPWEQIRSKKENFLQCLFFHPLLTKLNIITAGQENLFKGPVFISTDQAMRNDFELRDNKLVIMYNSPLASQVPWKICSFIWVQIYVPIPSFRIPFLTKWCPNFYSHGNFLLSFGETVNSCCNSATHILKFVFNFQK